MAKLEIQGMKSMSLVETYLEMNFRQQQQLTSPVTASALLKSLES